MPSIHSPLSDPSTHIRILTLPPSPDDSDVIRCTLDAVAIDSAPEFAAISYVWGDATQRRDILINDQPVSVTANLATGLAAIRTRVREVGGVALPGFLLWVDALCINQDDVAEKSAQVRLMGHIYGKARMVFAWLGESADDSDYAIDVLKRLAHEIHAESEGKRSNSPSSGSSSPVLDSPGLSSETPLWLHRMPELTTFGEDGAISNRNRAWVAITALLERQYWSRVWIQQEMVLAREMLVLCGNKMIHWGVLETVSWTLMHPGGRQFTDMLPFFPPILQALIPKHRFKALLVIKMIRYRANSSGVPYLIFDMVAMIEDSQATDPRDHIYGLMAITRSEIEIDYSRSVEELYREFSEKWILCPDAATNPVLRSNVGFAQHNLPNLPSWVVDLSTLTPESYAAGWPHGYQAAGYTNKASACISVEGRILRLKASVADTIATVEEKTDWEDFPAMEEQLRRLVNRALRQDVELEAPLGVTATLIRIFRTLLLDRERDRGQHLKVGSESFNRLFTGFVIAAYDFISRPRAEATAMANIVQRQCAVMGIGVNWAQVYERLFLPCAHILFRRTTGRVIIQTTGGRLGMGVPDCQPGDAICVVPGHDMPLVLRSTAEGHYQLVLSAYVQGLMEGEALGSDEESWLASLVEIEIH